MKHFVNLVESQILKENQILIENLKCQKGELKELCKAIISDGKDSFYFLKGDTYSKKNIHSHYFFITQFKKRTY